MPYIQSKNPIPKTGCGRRRVEQMNNPFKKKDACYHKVKARHDVFPSAYASGQIVQCRNVGADNWGKSKK